ncbi:MAG TPA: MFS transporter [Candidatus Methylomirabilis sp.]|nr:MFS transporter [Candidatus Methylomirabilis sp.]
MTHRTDPSSGRPSDLPHAIRTIPGALLSFLVVMFFLNIVSRLVLGPLLPIVEREFGLRHGTAGSLYFFITLGYCAGLYLSGYVAWWLSHRTTIGVSSITLGTALLAVYWTPSLSGMRVGLILLGVGSGLYLPSGIAALTENTRETSWGKALAIHELGPNLGYICAPLLTEFLLGFFSWRGVLGALGVQAILLGVVFLLSGLGESSPGQPPSLTTMAPLARDPALWGMAGVFAVSVGVGLGIYTMLPLFLVNEVGLDRVSANVITGLTRVSGLFSVFISGALADRLGRSRTVALCLAAAGVCTVVLGLLRGPWITPPVIFLQAACAAAFYPAAFAMISEVFPLPLRNVAVSMIMVLGVLLGAGVVPPAIGFLADSSSFSLAFSAAGLASLASLLLLGFFPFRTSLQRTEKRTDPL